MSTLPLRSRLTPEMRWLPVLRAVWVAVVAMLCFFWLVGQPTLFHHLVTPCTSHCSDFIGFTAQQWQVLKSVGIQPVPYGVVNIILLDVSLLIWLSVGGLIFLRRGDHLGMLVISLAIASNELMVSAPQLGVFVFGSWLAPLVGLCAAIGQVLWYAMFYLFPDGTFVPGWTLWVFVLGVVGELPQALQPPSAPVNQGPSGIVQGIITAAVYLVAFGAQIYRYRRAATSRQRQQSKWAVIGILVAFACQLAIVGYTTVSGDPVSYVAATTIVPLLQTAIPLSIGIAILRRRLYDIDVIINRTLVYGSLTAMLAGVYFGSVIGMQQLARLLVGVQGARNPLIIVLSTLLIAALFQPLRTRIQRTIDRRFYRTKYDAARTLDQFAATLRSQVDLAELNGHLISVVNETMQPTHVSLWLSSQRHDAPS